MRDNANADRSRDGFLVDGVAPAVIGGTEPAPDPTPTPPSIPAPAPDREPPTAPIPAQNPNHQPPRRSWFTRLFRS